MGVRKEGGWWQKDIEVARRRISVAQGLLQKRRRRGGWMRHQKRRWQRRQHALSVSLSLSLALSLPTERWRWISFFEEVPSNQIKSNRERERELCLGKGRDFLCLTHLTTMATDIFFFFSLYGSTSLVVVLPKQTSSCLLCRKNASQTQLYLRWESIKSRVWMNLHCGNRMHCFLIQCVIDHQLVTCLDLHADVHVKITRQVK